MLFTEHERDRLLESLHPSAVVVPRGLLAQVSGPGSPVFYSGSRRLLTLQRGRIEGHGFPQFLQAWGDGRFIENRQLAGAALPAPLLTPAQEECVVLLTLHMQRRALTQARSSGHGALIVLVPTRSGPAHGAGGRAAPQVPAAARRSRPALPGADAGRYPAPAGTG